MGVYFEVPHGRDFVRPPPWHPPALRIVGLCGALAESGERKKRSFGKGGLFRKVHVLEILENLETLEILEKPQTGKERGIRPFSRASGDFRDFRDSRDSSSEKTPFA